MDGEMVTGPLKLRNALGVALELPCEVETEEELNETADLGGDPKKRLLSSADNSQLALSCSITSSICCE
ncbi:hypothetical protein TYRP_019262 [Tyrophagus putrescentiae]|nr:hypothetical protein TYRP_019262 [Tyrophagus putrescentiae]